MAYEFEPWREKLRAAVGSSRYSQRALSIKAGQSDDYVRNIIAPSKGRDPITPTADKLHAVVKALDLSLDDIFEDEEWNTNDLIRKMASGRLKRLFSQITDLSPKAQMELLTVLEPLLGTIDKTPSKKPSKSPALRIIPPEE